MLGSEPKTDRKVLFFVTKMQFKQVLCVHLDRYPQTDNINLADTP
jgi:hypothetical protein